MSIWLQKIVWIYSYPIQVSVALVVSGATLCWTFAEASGAGGSPKLLLVIFLVNILVVALIALISKPLRWAILNKACKSYIQENLLGEFTDNKILIGIGPGGAIAVGMFAKAIRDLGLKPPSILVFDMKYHSFGENPTIGSFLSGELNVEPENCWIIQGNISSGRSLSTLIKKYKLQKAKVFAMVISEHVEYREKIDHFLAKGSRNILPWNTEKPSE